MKKEKGFTLIELLAVIIVLAIISLIAVPIILGVIDNVRKAAFERSVEMAMKSFDLYSATNETIKRIEITDERLPLEDNNFIGGALIRLIDGQIESQKITDGKYCASGKIGELEVTSGACVNDALDNFVINSYFLQVNPNGGIWNETEEISEVLVENNKKIDLVNPVRTGYAFTGWEMNVVGNIDDADNGTLTTEMKANWVGNNYKLVIDSAGGNYEGSSENVIVDVTAGKSIELKTPTREGYIFVEWEVTGQNSSITKNLFTMGIENATLTAKWQGEQYTVNYNCNGGEGSTESSVHTHGEASKLSVSKCFKVTAGTSGSVYYVSGWATSADATEATYAAEELVTDVSVTTLYAIYDNLFTYESGTYNVKNDGAGNWRVKLLTSGTFISDANIKIDAFLVGGGGGGASGGAAGGGGGGYTTTEVVTLEPSVRYSIVIGGGGSGARANQGAAAQSGTDTTAFGKVGYGGKAGTTSGGGAGGSGGGASGNTGGYNGRNGNGSAGGKGDGKPTCEFNEEISTDVCKYRDNGYEGFYSGGGGGRGNYISGGKGGGGRGSDNDLGNPVGGVNNTGGGGGGCHSNASGGGGGRGIVVIRNSQK